MVVSGAYPIEESETLRLRAGDNPLLLFYVASRKGWHAFTATISLPGDTVAANNSLSAVTDVLAAPRVLSVSTTGQMIIVVGALLGARSITPRAQVTLERVTQGRRYETQLRRIAAALAPLALPIAWLVLMWLSVLIAVQAQLARPAARRRLVILDRP